MTKLKADDEKLAQLIGEDGYFVITKKSVRWALGILSTVLVLLWGSLQYSIREANQNTAQTQEKIEKTNDALTALVKELEKDKVDPLDDEVDEMKGDVKVLLDRTNSRAGNTNSHGVITNPNLPVGPPAGPPN